MKTRDERMKELGNEEFYLMSFNGTQRPDADHYERIVMFDDIYYIDNENGSKSYNDMYSIKKMQEFIDKNLETLENLDKSDCEEIEFPKSSFANELHIRYDGNTYKVDRNLLTEESEIKFYDKFVNKIEEIFE